MNKRAGQSIAYQALRTGKKILKHLRDENGNRIDEKMFAETGRYMSF